MWRCYRTHNGDEFSVAAPEGDVILVLQMSTDDLITTDPDILGGTPVFKSTRVPVQTLFEYLEDDYTLDEFIECFPSLTADQARHVIERSRAAISHRQPRENPPRRVRPLAVAQDSRRP